MNTRKGILGLLLMALLPSRPRRLSALLFTVLMVLFSCSMFVSAFAKLSTQAVNFDAGMLAAWAIVGCVIWLLVGTIAFVLFFPYHRDEYA